MSKTKNEKKVRAVPIGLGILIFILAFGAGVVSKVAIKPAWAQKYAVTWSDALGTLKSDLPYGEGAANKFDLYLPKDDTKDAYGLVIYLHAGGFTSGDKADDRSTLAWLCGKGYVAAGINYTLRSDTNGASVLSQSNEIKAAVPKVIEAAEAAGYHIDKMAMAGGYVLAWFRWQLMGDAEAAQVFTGEAPELLTNPLYQDQKIDLDPGD